MIAAVIVLYYPDPDRLKQSLACITHQVQLICLIDNTPGDSAERSQIAEGLPESVSYVGLRQNVGLAAAQNIAIRVCLGRSCSHILFLDQDSLPAADLVSQMLAAECSLLMDGVRVGAVGPLFVDRKTQEASYAIRYGWFRARKILVEASQAEPVEADWIISSGSLVRSSVFEQTGGMKDDLFIDWVDAEWGFRARRAGFRHYIVPAAVMEHSVGEASRFVAGRAFNLHNNTRNYYIVRNATYLLRPELMGWKWTSAMLLRIPRYIALHAWFASARWRSLRTMLAAVVDGAFGRLGRAPSGVAS